MRRAILRRAIAEAGIVVLFAAGSAGCSSGPDCDDACEHIRRCIDEVESESQAIDGGASDAGSVTLYYETCKLDCLRDQQEHPNQAKLDCIVNTECHALVKGACNAVEGTESCALRQPTAGGSLSMSLVTLAIVLVARWRRQRERPRAFRCSRPLTT